MTDFSDPTAPQPEQPNPAPGDIKQVDATGPIRTLNKMFEVHVKMPGKPVKIYGAAIGGGGETAEAVAAVYERTNHFPGAESVEIHELADAPPPNVQALLKPSALGNLKVRPKTKLSTPAVKIVRLHDKLAGLGVAPDGSPLQNKPLEGSDASVSKVVPENNG